MRLHHDERGQTIILVALSLPLMLGFVGIATDVGALFKDKRDIQTAADAAAIAGALNLNYGNYITAAKNASTANGFTDGSNGVTVTVNNKPTWTYSNYKGVSGYVEATVTKTESTIFLTLFGFPSVTVQARAVSTTQGPGNGCTYTLGTTGNDMHIQGSAVINASTCGLYVNSSSSNAITQTGSAASATFSTIGVVGDPTGLTDYTPHPPITGMEPVADPLSFIPNYSCTTSGATTSCSCSSTSYASCTGYPYTSPVTCVNATGTTLSPGCYNGLSGAYSLTSGTYIINGDISGAISGTGVTLIITAGSIATTGNKTITLSAPSAANDPDDTNPFDGIVIYQVRSDAIGADMKGTPTLNAQGVIYMPAASFTLQGNASGTIYADFVVNSLNLQGNPTINDYQALSGVQSPIHSIALVE